ncbi:MAG: YopX family protein [Huintestinicola sp.]
MSKDMFRGKRTANGKWIEGYAFKQHRSSKGEECYIRTYETDYYVDPKTVGQFTGFCDKNKCKAFEGDILSHCDGLDYGVIKYGEYTNPFSHGQHIGFYVDWVAGENKGELRKDLGYWLKAGTAEIVGNVYDNPELINN